MKTVLASISVFLLLPQALFAAPQNVRQEIAPDRPYVDRIEMVGAPLPAKATADTMWIAEWTFDGGGGLCDDSGWTTHDERNELLTLGHSVYWSAHDSFDSVGNIQGQAAVLGHHELCGWVFPDGYDNDWYQGICIPYVGASSLSFDYLVDSEDDYDFLQVETDSACSSFTRLTQEQFTTGTISASLRSFVWAVSGFDTLGVADSLSLSDYSAASDTHCVYISFYADGAYSPADGLQSTTLGVAAVVDNVVLTGSWPLVEDFEAPVDPRITYLNMYDDRGVGDWARVYHHITDNDLCTENTTCAWLWTDDQTPTIANHPDMAFGPGGYVIKNWQQNAIIGPWVSLSTSMNNVGTVLSFQRFGGNFFTTSKIVHNYSVRGKKKIDNTDSPAPDDSIDCLTQWGHANQNHTLSFFTWLTRAFDLGTVLDPQSYEIQLRFRTKDYQFINNATPPTPFLPGPGPYLDDVRIGRLILQGPGIDWGIDARYQAQDAFPTQLIGGLPGEHHEPTMDRFGTTAFSRSGDLAINNISPNLITGDSITVDVTDVRGAGGVTSVDWYGSIVSGPHAGKAPPPYSVQANGFFQVAAEMARNSSGVLVQDRYFVDLDDDYFRGGDVLLYYWQAIDALAGVSSLPKGIAGTPADIAEAELLTGGLLEVSFLPTINWDPAYLARIAADQSGKLEPTQQELDNSEQATCFLYAQMVNTDRRSGDLNRTSFQFTLDQLGYRGFYDVYDLQGLGNTNNQLGGRATVEQAEGYALVIHDAGAATPGSPIVPDGTYLDTEKIDQIGWFQQYLAAGQAGEAGSASVWIIGADAVEERPLAYAFMSTGIVSPDQGLTLNPTVAGEPGTHTFASGVVEDFSTDEFVLLGGCPITRTYDALSAVANGVVTHRFREGATVGDGAVIIASDSVTSSNTVMMSIVWGDVRDASGIPGTPEKLLAQKILSGVLPNGCVGTPTDIGIEDDIAALPARTALHQNTPNPFNPTTRIAFDLATEGRVTLRIYDVAGRLVREVLDEVRQAGFNQSVIWDGRDARGRRVASGIYFYRLATNQIEGTRKLVVMK